MDFLVDIEYEPKKMEQLGRLLRREVLTMVVGTYGDVRGAQGSEFPPPTPLSATASFGKTYRPESVNLYSLFGYAWILHLHFGDLWSEPGKYVPTFMCLVKLIFSGERYN